ncbi:hypothetical protein FE257_009946 [Aspergillus nanangensis]|uniref:Amino acid permease/ SLC12A domain-containing protein n=1 Tax=Aspergillus nanangensis TaxID=2582783 RepID=A0AAD4CW38_ASPNN|nr:hypothetical protein FE257_009946 [Aspergillus nanangensis]
MAAIFISPLSVFGWFEYFSSMMKIILFLLLLVISLALIGGAGPTGSVHRGSTWTENEPFKNGFSGFADCAIMAVWAVGDQIVVSTMAGEAQNPRYSFGHATRLVPFRVAFIFLSSLTAITLLVPSDDNRLLGGSGVTASPFVIALNDAGVPVVPHIMNAGMVIGILGNGAETLYTASRILRTMAHQALIPEFFAKVDDRGRPRAALLITGTIAIILTYINLSSNGSDAITWLIAITSASFFTNWLIVGFTSFRFHHALQLQRDPLFSEPYAWRSARWPLAPTWLLLVSLLLLACCFTVGLKPPGKPGINIVENFFQYMLGFLLIVGFTLGYKMIFRTSWRDLKKADHVTGRHRLSAEEINELDLYYSKPRWRRFLSYIQLW